MKLLLKLSVIFSMLFCSLKVSISQPVPSLVYIDTVLTNNVASKSFYVKNPVNKILQITATRTLTSKFYFTVNSFNINPYDSVLITVYFRTNQNVTYRDFLIFENKTLKYPIIYYGLTTAKYPDTIYRYTQGLYDENLKTVLRSHTTTGYVSLGYDNARDNMFATVDKYLTNDTIECVYIGRKIRAVNRTEAQNLGFDTEHTFPQSFFGSLEPMKSDLFHMYPTDTYPNNKRSNYPFGIVVTATWDSAGSKLGHDYENVTVFEPRNKHKGNVARSLFYFCVKYNNVSPGGFMTTKQENALRLWNVSDTVDANERARNNRIAALEHVRNPFIDHPELIDRIKSTFTVAVTTPAPKVSASPFNVVYDTLSSNDTSSYYVALMNYGTAALTVNSVTSSISQFIVENFPASVPLAEMRYIKVKFHPTAINQTYNGTLTINNSDSTIIVNLKGFSNSTIGIKQISSDVPDNFALHQNYPNPFNPSTIINYQLAMSSYVNLKIFDITGKEVKVLVNTKQEAGTYEVEFNAENLPSGVYFYKLITDNFSDTKRALLLK
jgi:hypothetical protein